MTRAMEHCGHTVMESALVLGLWVSYITLICLISLLYSEDHNVKVKVMMKVIMDHCDDKCPGTL